MDSALASRTGFYKYSGYLRCVRQKLIPKIDGTDCLYYNKISITWRFCSQRDAGDDYGAGKETKLYEGGGDPIRLHFACKSIGLLFSIPLANLIDPKSMSYFYAAYDIFGFFLMLSTAGLPIAVSRMVGTAYAQGRRKEADQVFGVAFWLFLV